MPRIEKPEELVLSNGIPVILQHHEGTAAATYWWVRTGSGDEMKNEEGFAHFLEHMLFKDAAAKETGKASTGQMAHAVESLGGDINAYTSFDQTVYHVTCAAHHWERVIDVFGPMAKPQKFLKSDFEREREVILEELKKNEDSPGRQLFQALFSSTYRKHPYGRPVIGFAKTLKAATVGKLEAFYKRAYVSEKMGLVLVGPSRGREKELMKLLEKHFGEKMIPRRKATPFARPVEPELRPGLNIVKRPFDVKTPTLAIAFRAPELRHADIPALDLASGVLAMGELSRLYQRLFYGSSIATDVSGGLYVPRDPGMLYFQAEVDEIGKIEPAAKQIFEELDRMRREGPTDEELQRVLVNAESERLYATQTADGIAGRLGFLRFILGDLNFDREFLEELRAVDKVKMRETLGRYLDYRRMSGSLLLSKEQAGYDLEPITAAANRMFAPVGVETKPVAAKAKAKGKVIKAGISSVRPEFITRPSGLRVIYRENPASHVMSVHAATLGGLRLELGQPVESKESDWGSSYMMSLTWTKGTKGRDARAIAALAEGSAAGIDGFSGRNTVGVQLTGLARDWGKLSPLFSEVLVEPTFPDSEVDHSRRVAEDSVRGIEDHTSQLCSKHFLETLFEKHPYGHLTTGSLDSLKKIDGAKLRKFHRDWMRPERMVVSVVGAVKRNDLDSWMTDLEARLASLGGGGSKGGNGHSVPELPEEPSLVAPRWVEKTLGREQTHILVGSLGTRVTADDRHVLRLMQTLLSGQSGRLFIELREKKSLAYTVAPVSFEGIERGYVGTYIACSPNKREEAVKGIQEVLTKLAEKGPSKEEMKRAQEFFLGRRAMDLQSDSSLATHYSLEAVYGIPYLDEQEMVERITSITPKRIMEVCSKYLVDQPMVTAVVG